MSLSKEGVDRVFVSKELEGKLTEIGIPSPPIFHIDDLEFTIRKIERINNFTWKIDCVSHISLEHVFLKRILDCAGSDKEVKITQKDHIIMHHNRKISSVSVGYDPDFFDNCILQFTLT